MDLPNENVNSKEKYDSDESLDSLMQLENFKSNFARRLSSRSISKSSLMRDTALKLCVRDDMKKEDNNQTQELNVINSKNEKESVKSQENNPKIKAVDAGAVLENTKLTVLNMEIETLRWQLTQTESNRQMQIELLRDIVCFLSKVKEHMTSCIDNSMSNSTASININESAFKDTELPRSHSALNLKKNQELMNVPKKIKNKKISKSNSNVSRFKDIHYTWTQSSIALASEERQHTKKLTDEITRLITLANDFIKTKIPDLACTNEPNESIGDDFISKHELLTENKSKKQNNSVGSLISSDESNKSHCDEAIPRELSLSPSSYPEEEMREVPCKKYRGSNKKDLVSYNEAESGFCSMNSYQEIGVPEINVIPPSPKDIGYANDPCEAIHSTTNSNPEILDNDNDNENDNYRKKQLYLLLEQIKDANKYSYMTPYEEVGVPDLNDISQSEKKGDIKNIFSTNYTKYGTEYIDLYQNIGIPVINVIPPSPGKVCVDVICPMEKLQPDEKQEGKVFWV